MQGPSGKKPSRREFLAKLGILGAGTALASIAVGGRNFNQRRLFKRTELLDSQKVLMPESWALVSLKANPLSFKNFPLKPEEMNSLSSIALKAGIEPIQGFNAVERTLLVIAQRRTNQIPKIKRKARVESRQIAIVLREFEKLPEAQKAKIRQFLANYF